MPEISPLSAAGFRARFFAPRARRFFVQAVFQCAGHSSCLLSVFLRFFSQVSYKIAIYPFDETVQIE